MTFRYRFSLSVLLGALLPSMVIRLDEVLVEQEGTEDTEARSGGRKKERWLRIGAWYASSLRLGHVAVSSPLTTIFSSASHGPALLAGRFSFRGRSDRVLIGLPSGESHPNSNAGN